MLESEREAKRLMSDTSSYSQGTIKHKAYRQMALRPEEEVPKHRSSRKKKTKHVHKWGEWIQEGKTIRRRWSTSYRSSITVFKWVRICKRCGHRDHGESTSSSGTPKRGRYWYW